MEINIKILGSDICLPIESCLRIKSDQETPFDLLLEMGFVSSYVTTIDVEIFSVIGNMLRFIRMFLSTFIKPNMTVIIQLLSRQSRLHIWKRLFHFQATFTC